ncbi:hypothetical protein MTR_5g080915 [Medicago truncatula]|uniref:Transmembrane protein n=1 Tax=Medicago truncatula TaxID=3880 RepID=A0A072UES0_MEDTR|nr:hypothetical protein MTR_5g080915 [Medicago truncatula]
MAPLISRIHTSLISIWIAISRAQSYCYSTNTCHGKEEGETSTHGERNTMDSCMLRSGRMNRSRKGIY